MLQLRNVCYYCCHGFSLCLKHALVKIWYMDLGEVQLMVETHVEQYTEIPYFGHLIHKFVKGALPTIEGSVR